MVSHSLQISQSWEVEAEFRDYMSAVDPVMPEIGVEVFPQTLYAQGESRVIPLDLATTLQVPYPCTTPNLLASFVRINAAEQVDLATPATSHMFYVIQGAGSTESDEFGAIHWRQGDLFTLPSVPQIRHLAAETAVLYWVCDSPLLQYLGVSPQKQRFRPVLYRRERLDAALQRAREEHGQANRSGILLSNPNFPQTQTLTHTLWSLYNALPAGVTQKPHRHNSVALDYCVAAGPDTYTLIGQELDQNGQIINPIKAPWIPGCVFVTPPGYWHSHHNDSDQDAIVLPIQDAGLLTNMQVLDFQYIH